MLEMADDIVYELFMTYLLGATFVFNLIFKKDLTIENYYIRDDLTLDEKFILSRGMILYWLQSKINNQEVIKNRITDGDYVIKSPANLLEKLLKLKTSTEKDMRRRITRYSYKDNKLYE